MKNKDIRKLHLVAGWFSGEPFKLFDLTLFESWSQYESGSFTIFELTIAHFSIQLNYAY